MDKGTIIGIIGIGVSIICAVPTFYQAFKAKRAAEAAVEAARQTQLSLKRNVLLVDVATFLRTLEEVKDYVRTKRYESARLRVTDLHLSLMQLQYLEDMPGSVLQDGLEEKLAELPLIQERLERKVNSPSTKIDPNRINSQLPDISALLSKRLGQGKYSISQGEPR